MNAIELLFPLFCMCGAYIAGTYHAASVRTLRQEDWLTGSVIALGVIGLLSLGGGVAIAIWGQS